MTWLNNVMLGVLGCLAGAGSVSAQARLFPSAKPFEYPDGSLRTSGTVGRIVSVRLAESAFGPEQEADVWIGENVPVVGLGAGPAAPFLGLTIRVSGRFSLDDPKSALISNDWVAGIHVVTDRGPWRLAAELLHESSHLGDEYAARFDAQRVDWTRNFVALWVARSLGPATLHATGSWVLIDELDLPRWAGGAGADVATSLGQLAGAEVRPMAGGFVAVDGFAGGEVTATLRAGLDLVRSGQRLGVALVALDGVSPQRQFYDRRTRYWGFELRFDW